MKHKTHHVDFCVVGGGMAGMCAAISAARHGAKVVLMQDRPVLGGNASSEIRMWICGAHGENNRETGIIEEIELESLYRNSPPNFSVWDSVLYEKVVFEPNIKLLLNCSCNRAEMDGDKIKSVIGWQLTTETWWTVEADYFADCSGDGILAPLTGARFRLGREARSEFNESIAPEKADDKTMGMSCLIQTREYGSPQTFVPPAWAYKYPNDDSLRNRGHVINQWQNFWWLEVGGVNDTIHDTEELRHELLKIAFGVWDHIKNNGDHGAENWSMEWLGFLPGKRESRRFEGDYILSQNDIRAEGRFDDLVAYGGWSMDDHHPDGFYHSGPQTIFHEAPSPYGIPYRCLYSKNISNLFFAGRDISCTHSAMSSTRVMATCAIMGQAVGTAAAICTKNGILPHAVYKNKIKKLKQTLMDDDCYFPWNQRDISKPAKSAEITASTGSPCHLRNGFDRPVGENTNAWDAGTGDWVQYAFDSIEHISEIRIVFDSDLNRKIRNMPSNYPLSGNREFHIPHTLVKAFVIEYMDKNNCWQIAFKTENNYQRLRKIPLNIHAKKVKMTIKATHGVKKARIFAFEPK